MYQHVWAKEFWTKEVYLGVRLGQRGMRAQLSGGVFAQFISAYRASEEALGLADEAVPASEIARWTEQAERRGRALCSSALPSPPPPPANRGRLVRHALAATARRPT